MGFPNKGTVERLRGQYPKGTRVELVRMDDPYGKLKPGERGTVDFVDDAGTVFVNWDSGSGLGVVFGEDAIKKVPAAVPGKVREQILAIHKMPGCPNMFDATGVQRLAFDSGFYELVCFIETDAKAYASFILTGEGYEE